MFISKSSIINIKKNLINIQWKQIGILLFKALLIVLLFNIADRAYCMYNPDYPCKEIWYINDSILFTIIGILLINKIALRILFLTIIVQIVLLEYLYFQYFGIFIQPIAFYQVFTNTNEVMISFLDEIHSMIVPIGIMLSLLLVIVIMKTMKLFNSYRNTTLGILILISIFLTNLFNTYSNVQMLQNKTGESWWDKDILLMPQNDILPFVNYMRALNYVLIVYLPNELFSEKKEVFPTLTAPNITDDNPNRNIIFIIGESLRAKNVNLLGYKKETTPQLGKIDKLYYNTIYSAGTMTKVSVPALLNRIQYPGAVKQLNNKKNNLFKLAKENGFITHYYSTQTKSSEKNIQNNIGRKFIDNYADLEILKKKTKTKCSYDICLKQALETINLNKHNNFIVLHQKGSHHPYHTKYPKKYKKFEFTYDNSILYTDYVLSEIILYLKSHTKKPTYIIFTSDHGELIDDYGRNGHGAFFEEVYKVPFFYYDINKDLDSKQKIPLDNIQTHFNVSNLIVSLMGYDINITKMSDIYVNGSNVDSLDGYLHIKLDKTGKEISVKKVDKN